MQPIKIEGIPHNAPALWDYDGLCEYLGISGHTARRWVSDGRIPYRKIGGIVRFDVNEIVAWIESKARRPRS